MFFRRKRRNKRDSELDVINNQNVPPIVPNDFRDRRGSRRGSIVGRIWKSMRMKRRNPLPDVRQPEVFREPRHRASDPTPPSIPNNREMVPRRDDSCLDNILTSRMKSYNVSPAVSAVTNLVISPTRGSPSANEFNSSQIRSTDLTNNELLVNNPPRVSLSNQVRRRSASADRNRRHEENQRLLRLREDSNNIIRPRSHDYEGQGQNNRLQGSICNTNNNNQERPVSDSRLLERYFRQPDLHESRSRATQPNNRSSRSRSAEVRTFASPQLPITETSEREIERAERNNRENRIIYQSREQRSNNYRHNNTQRENIERLIPNEFERTDEPNERIHEFIRELRVTNAIPREQSNNLEVFQEIRGNLQRSSNETRDIRMGNRDIRMQCYNLRDGRIIAENSREYNLYDLNTEDNIHRTALPREYRPVAVVSHGTRELYESLYTMNQQEEVLTSGNTRVAPPSYDEVINRQYTTTTLRSRPPSYSHVIEEIMNERLLLNPNISSRMNQPTRLQRNPPLAIRS